jgi:hypothetical protein
MMRHWCSTGVQSVGRTVGAQPCAAAGATVDVHHREISRFAKSENSLSQSVLVTLAPHSHSWVAKMKLYHNMECTLYVVLLETVCKTVLWIGENRAARQGMSTLCEYHALHG